MKVTVIEDAKVLIPNKEHLNFTEGNEVIKKGTEIEGNPKQIKGKRRGEDFVYKLFGTNDNKIIYLKKIKPMEKTEVTLGADAQTSATIVDIPVGKKLFTKNATIYMLIGAAAGFGFAKYKKYKTGKIVMSTSVGAVAGFALGTYVDKHLSVKVKKSV